MNKIKDYIKGVYFILPVFMGTKKQQFLDREKNAIFFIINNKKEKKQVTISLASLIIIFKSHPSHTFVCNRHTIKNKTRQE